MEKMNSRRFSASESRRELCVEGHLRASVTNLPSCFNGLALKSPKKYIFCLHKQVTVCGFQLAGGFSVFWSLHSLRPQCHLSSWWKDAGGWGMHTASCRFGVEETHY